MATNEAWPTADSIRPANKPQTHIKPNIQRILLALLCD